MSLLANVLTAGALADIFQTVGSHLFAILSALATVIAILLSFYASWRLRKELKDVEAALDEAWSPPLEAERNLLRDVAEEFDEPSELVGSTTYDDTTEDGPSIVYAVGIELENIRCFPRFGLSFEGRDGPYLTTS